MRGKDGGLLAAGEGQPEKGGKRAGATAPTSGGRGRASWREVRKGDGANRPEFSHVKLIMRPAKRRPMVDVMRPAGLGKRNGNCSGCQVHGSRFSSWKSMKIECFRFQPLNREPLNREPE